MGEGWRDSQGPRRALILLGHGPDFSLFSLSVDDYFLLSPSTSPFVSSFSFSRPHHLFPSHACSFIPFLSLFLSLSLILFLPSLPRSSPNLFEENTASLLTGGLRFRARRSLFSALVSELFTYSNKVLRFQQNVHELNYVYKQNFAS